MNLVRLAALLLIASLPAPSLAASSYQYFRLGNKEDRQTPTTFGAALMGGGDDLDEGFRWLCEKGGGGDFLILRARGDDEYNPYVNGLCKTNSVSTLIIPDREAAEDPAVADIIRHAEVLFIAGGDQSRYVYFWRGTPVNTAINDDLAAHKPIGGTSAGLAILTQFGYSAIGDKPDDNDLSSPQVLQNPFFDRVTLVREFLAVPHLENTISDTHFAKRDRMGRTLGFLARLMQDGWTESPREIAVDEKSAVLMEADGKTRVIGPGRGAYFLRPKKSPEVCKANAPLTFTDISAYRAPEGATFDVTSWSGKGGLSYTISVEKAVIHTTQPGDAVY